MGRPQFTRDDFLGAARSLVVEHGPAAATVESITQQLEAPVGSFYHRFSSRDVLLGELWLENVLAFQEGFLGAIDAGDGLAAALHAPRWSRDHLEQASVMILYGREEFVRGAWPPSLKERVAEQAQQVDAAVRRFARAAFGSADRERVRRASFVLVDVPVAVVRPHLRRREPPPRLVDELVATTYHAVVGRRGAKR